MSYLSTVTETEREAQLDRYIAGVAKEDWEAMTQLYNATRASVYGFALSILKNPQDAEDVLHDCYLQIHAAASGYRSQGKALAWILTITRNLCMQKLREVGRYQHIEAEDWEKYVEAQSGMDSEDRLVLLACMERLSDEERQIVMLHAVSGFKHREIAKLLKLPLPTVLSKYNRALKKLKQYLLKENAYEEQRN